MNKTFFYVLLLVAGVDLHSLGQGTVVFNNRVTPLLDARVTFSDGTPVGAGFTAQLYGGPVGTPVESLSPLLPTTTFRLTSTLSMGYVIEVHVRVPGVPAWEDAALQMRVFDGPTWESSLCRGESNLIEVRLSNEGLPLPANLYGMEPFQVVCIPEPGPAALLACGVAGWIAFGRRGRRSRSSQPQSAGTLVPP